MVSLSGHLFHTVESGKDLRWAGSYWWKRIFVIGKQRDESFVEWVTTYDAILWKVARSYAPLGEHEELHQDLLIALWNAIPLYREQAKASTFIYRVSLNCALNWTRARARYQRRHVELHDVAVTSVDREPVDRLYRALGMLSEADRSIALLYLDDLSYREIGEVLGITESNVGVKLHRVKKTLTELLL